MFPEILVELHLVRDISIKIHVEIADEIEVNMLFHRLLPSTGCLSGISSETDCIWYFSAEISSKKKDCPCKKKLEGALQIRQTNNRRLKLVEVCSLKFFQNYFQCRTFPLTFMLEMQMRLKKMTTE